MKATKTKQTIKQALEATGRTLYVNWEVAESSPAKQKGKVEFFTLDRSITDEALDQEYESRGLTPASLWNMCEVDPDTLDNWVATHWKDKNGRWCCAVFGRSDGSRGVGVDWSGVGWRRLSRFGGVRKSSALKSYELSGSLALELRVQILEEKYRKVTKLAEEILEVLSTNP